MTLFRRVSTIVLLAALGSWVVPAPSALAHCGGKPTRIHAYHVETVWDKKVYKRGDTALVEVTVTRPAHEDPLELGIPLDPPVSVPEQGATVTTYLITDKFPPPFGRDVTNAEGKVTLKIPIRGVDPGPVDANTYASKWTNEGGCPDIEEWGYRPEQPAFIAR